MASVSSKAERLNPSFTAILRWVALLPIGLGILWIAEEFAKILVDLVLDWNQSTVFFFVVVIGGGCLLFFSIVVLGAGMRMLTSLIAPHYRAGAILLSITYVLIQIVGLYGLLGAVASTWPYILTKIEFTGVVVFMLLCATHEASEGGPV